MGGFCFPSWLPRLRPRLRPVVPGRVGSAFDPLVSVVAASACGSESGFPRGLVQTWLAVCDTCVRMHGHAWTQNLFSRVPLPLAALRHYGNTTLTDKSRFTDSDLVVSGGRHFSIGNRQRRGVHGRLVRQPLVLSRSRRRTIDLATTPHLICQRRRARLGRFGFNISPGTSLQIA